MVEDFFLKLVSIASPSGSEAEICNFVKFELEALRLMTIIDKQGNVLSKQVGKGEPILLCAHLDTVQKKGSVIEPKRVNGHYESAGDTILGADNKATVASLLAALKTQNKFKKRNLEIIFSVREETDSGIKGIDLSWIKSKTGITADSGEDICSIIMETPYIESFGIKVEGVSSHSSEPEKGINALSVASHAISSLDWGNIDEYSTANIGLIEGGSAVNTTPSEILLKGEIRSYRLDFLNKALAKLNETFKTSAKMYRGNVSISHERYCDGYTHDKSDMAIEKVKNIYAHLNFKENYKRSFGGSDANFFNSKGIKVIDIGDGVKNPHSFKETISVYDLDKLTDIFSSLIVA